MLLALLLLGGAAAAVTVYGAFKKSPAPAVSNLPGQPAPTYSPNYPSYNPAPSSLVAAPSMGTIEAGVGLTAASTGLNMYQQSQQRGDGGGGGGSATATAAIAGVAIVGAVFGALMAAHAQRVKQATDENSAVNLGVKGFDADVANIANAVNTKQITAGQAIQYILQAKANFWALCSPHIQPGRNGCQSGAACPGGQVGDKATAPEVWILGKGTGRPTGCTTGQCACTGSIGAACCVGCNCINGATANLIALWSSGKTGTTGVCKVFASKYGGQDRPAYLVQYAA